MKCPYCTSNDTRVINSRPSDEGIAIRRRRECADCHRRFTTYERAQFEALMVNKRSGRREPFNPDKLLDKLRIASNKRPITEKQLREFAYGLEDEIQTPEIASEEIGARTLKFLKGQDDVAYIRFLSVYRDFDSVDRFIEEIKQLGEAPPQKSSGPASRAVAEENGRQRDIAATAPTGGEQEDDGSGTQPEANEAEAAPAKKAGRKVATQAPLIPSDALESEGDE